mmetsp:Transcript_1648/g.3687  ORF Transcript_1648/g.3687 Transcript_1648/m.3687 type:complete len:202 (+) Transcript_1648:764-1369(+)
MRAPARLGPRSSSTNMTISSWSLCRGNASDRDIRSAQRTGLCNVAAEAAAATREVAACTVGSSRMHFSRSNLQRREARRSSCNIACSRFNASTPSTWSRRRAAIFCASSVFTASSLFCWSSPFCCSSSRTARKTSLTSSSGAPSRRAHLATSLTRSKASSHGQACFMTLLATRPSSVTACRMALPSVLSRLQSTTSCAISR